MSWRPESTPKGLGMLTDTRIRTTKPREKPFKLFDGRGLYVEVSPVGGKLWRLKYRFGGKEKLLALGRYPEVGLARAPNRLVSNSPSVSDNPGITSSFGEDKNNRALDYLTPHTIRQAGVDKHWEVAPLEIGYLIERYRKPVVDDEPARNGVPRFGGPKAPTDPYDHILQIYRVWQLGGYIVYHHDMFQTGYGTPAVPPSGIPDPEFSPYHKTVLQFIAKRERYQPVKQ